jgi:polyhydroxyalkanoate synthase
MARFTVGVSPMTLIGAYADWAAHLSFSPGKQLQLAEKALRKWLRLVTYANRTAIHGCEGRALHRAAATDRRSSARLGASPVRP